jgi:hypothetical protein
VSVVSAKSLNGTLGKEDFRAFDIAISESVDSIIETINKNTDELIANRKRIKKIVADTEAKLENRRWFIGSGYNSQTGGKNSFSAKMPCDGSFYVYGGIKKKTISVYINGVIQSLWSRSNENRNPVTQKAKEAVVMFKQGDLVEIVLNDENEVNEVDGYSYFYVYAFIY